MNPSNTRLMDRLRRAAEQVTGATVDEIEAPGGTGRTSLRLRTSQGAIIGTRRENSETTSREAEVLRRLAPATDRVPGFLGIEDGFLFQSDVGERRLNLEIVRQTGARRAALAQEAVAAIFEMHAASRGLGLEAVVPALGAGRPWVESVVAEVDTLARIGPAIDPGLDRDAIADALTQAPVQFIKWDCRAGNAALGPDDRLRWFDFEYAGLRHGAEDFAWLFADEVWPMSPAFMLDAFNTAWDPATPHDRGAYLSYLSLYIAMHSLQRLGIILSSQSRKGWKKKASVRRYDFAGVHPDFGVQLCDVAAFFADRNPLSRSLVRNFEAARAVFGDMQKMEAAQRTAKDGV